MTGTPPSSVVHLSVVITTDTTDDVTQTTGANVVTSPSSRGIEFYFQCAVIVIGIVGTAANALIPYGFIASKQHTKHRLIFHQNVLDFFGSLLMVITSSLKLCNFYFSGFDGLGFCILIHGEYFSWVVFLAGKINLIFVTIERYLKVVYSVWSKNKLGNWMIYSAMAFAWISGFVYETALLFPTSALIDGVCYAYAFWKSPAGMIVNGILFFFYFYVTVLIILIFCYGHILVVIRRQARVMASHGSSTAHQAHSQEIQTNVIKTMIIVSASFAVCDMPINVYYMLRSVGSYTPPNYAVYYASMFASFLYICANPFIYATKFDPVRNILLKLIPCKKTSSQPV